MAEEQTPDISASERERLRHFFNELPGNLRRHAEDAAPPTAKAKQSKYSPDIDDHGKDTPIRPPTSRRSYGPLKIRR